MLNCNKIQMVKRINITKMIKMNKMARIIKMNEMIQNVCEKYCDKKRKIARKF
jgi:hypothetical protein